MKNTKSIKPQFLHYDWKESPGEVFKDLEPVLKTCGVYLIEDPLSIGTDSFGYILTSNPKFTIGEYRKILSKEFDKETDDWIKEMMADSGLTDKDSLQKLSDSL